jgi:hypothetical protein
MPQSRTRTSRQATRAKYRKPKRRRTGSMAWTVAIVMVAVVFSVFVALQVASNHSSSASGAPYFPDPSTGQAGSHWHTYLGVNICGEWLSAQPTFDKPADSPNQDANVGIHTHGDGLIHTHPFVASEAGGNATLGKFADYGGWSVSSDSIDAWTGPTSKPKQTSWSNGDTCTFGDFKGQKGELVWAVDGKAKTGNPSDYHQQNGQTIAIGFLPKGTALPFPPDACSAFANISDQNTPAAVSKSSPCLTQSTSTTAPGDTTTTTTAPGG